MRVYSNSTLVAARTQPRDLNPRMKLLFGKLRERGAKGATVSQLAKGSRYNRWLLTEFVKKGFARVQGESTHTTSRDAPPKSNLVDTIARAVAARLLSQERVMTPPMTRDDAWKEIRSGVSHALTNGKLAAA